MSLVCQRCGGPLAPEAAHAAVTCPYCGATTAPPPEVVAVGRVRPMGAIAPPETRLPCPRCSDFLTETRIRESMLSACKSCGGVWLDSATIDRLRRSRDVDIEAAAARVAARVITDAPPDLELSIACPVCKGHLRRTSIAGAPHAIDVCDAHGTWFDRAHADELMLFIGALEALRAGNDRFAAPAPAPALASGGQGFFARLFGSRG